jgi:hypothetical protein
MKKDKTYAVVTVISTHRIRYVIPMDELQNLNPESTATLAWAEDCVTCDEVEEFSQKHLGETIVDTVEMSQEEVLTLFDTDNDYLKAWPNEQKIDHIHKWHEIG